MMELTPDEVHIITEYRKLYHGKLIITKRNGHYADGETVGKWDKNEVTRPRRRLRETMKKK
jgi:hypothetical protein